MGAGKTTLGWALSKILRFRFYDLDWYIETRMRKTIAQIFEERGEDGFRVIERNMLHEVAEFENVIIACGGGTPCFFDNMDYLNQQGETVYMNATADKRQVGRRNESLCRETDRATKHLLQEGKAHC